MASSFQTLPKIKQPFANGGNRRDIPDSATGTNQASMAEGWNNITSKPITDDPATTGTPPNRLDFNQLGYLATVGLLFLQQGGIVTYDSTVSTNIGGYPKGAVLWVMSNNIPQYAVRSTINNNTNNPASNMTGWEKLTINPSGDAMTGILSNVNDAQLRNIQLVTNEPSSGTDGTIYAIIE